MYDFRAQLRTRFGDGTMPSIPNGHSHLLWSRSAAAILHTPNCSLTCPAGIIIASQIWHVYPRGATQTPIRARVCLWWGRSRRQPAYSVAHMFRRDNWRRNGREDSRVRPWVRVRIAPSSRRAVSVGIADAKH